MRPLLIVLCLLALSTSDAPVAQPTDSPTVTRPRGPRQMSGPRFGVTYLPPALVRRIDEDVPGIRCLLSDDPEACEERPGLSSPVVSQFGWQLERRTFQTTSGVTGLTELVLLVGGLEQGLLLPSATFLVGVRTPAGLEAGIGPNVTPLSLGLALSAGTAQDFGDLAVPVNAAVVLGPEGPRVSLLIGVVLSDRVH